MTETDTSKTPNNNNKGTLILTCCHAIFTGTNPLLESHWLLAPFQQSRGTPSSPYKESEHFTFLRHIIASVLELLKVRSDYHGRSSGDTQYHPPAHIVFSGGATKRALGCELSEGASYLAGLRWLIEHGGNLDCDAAGGFGDVPRALRQDIAEMHAALASFRSTDDGPDLKGFLERHVHAETFATDSFQNMLFGLLQFRGGAGCWPEKVVVVTHEFKRRRVVELHARALGVAKDRLEVVGIDPPFGGKEEEEEIRKGEMERGFSAFESDLYGCKESGMLGTKRVERGWGRGEKIEVAREYLSDWNEQDQRGLVERLLEWNGGKDGRELFNERLPWETGQRRY